MFFSASLASQAATAAVRRGCPMLLVLCLLMSPGLGAAPPPAAATDDAGAEVHLHFFWSQTCPHCRRARPFVESLPERYPWLTVHSLDVSGDPANAALYVDMASDLGVQARAVPAFLFCGAMLTGYDADETTGLFLEKQLFACREAKLAERAAGEPRDVPAPTSRVVLPVLGVFDPSEYSLPVLTLVLAALDSFNPCAFFVLLFLLSLLVHARSRLRIALIGGTFVFFSGLVYFVFMAAWLNLFLVMGQVRVVTALAGGVAVLLALLNVKDYVWLERGPSLRIPESVKPGLFQRMRSLVNAESMTTMMTGTVALAVAANTYELLCTAGFPMVFTRVLTLSEVAGPGYYLYLLLYNLIYVVPLAVFVVLFAATLGSRKLSEREGRILKLVSGLMMLQLGLVLLLAPEIMNNVLAAVAMLAAAVALTVVVEATRRKIGESWGREGVGDE